jgi:hypothetical protein
MVILFVRLYVFLHYCMIWAAKLICLETVFWESVYKVHIWVASKINLEDLFYEFQLF